MRIGVAALAFHSASVWDRSIVVLSIVCLRVFVCEHISETTCSIVIEYFLRDRVSVLLSRRCDMLCTSCFYK